MGKEGASIPPHPYADKPSPYEETMTILQMAWTTFIQFCTIDILGGLLYYSWKTIEKILLPIAAAIGFLGLCCSKLKKKVKKPATAAADSKTTGEEEERGDFVIVVDLDQTLIFSKPVTMPAADLYDSMTSSNSCLYI